MYKCEKHGKLDSHWCEECQEICHCDCSETTETRFKDLIIIYRRLSKLLKHK
jgi:hypothetical protein